MDLRSLSLKSPSRYWLAASRWGHLLKHALNPSMNCPNRRSNARADPVVVVTHGSVRTSVRQYKCYPVVMLRIREDEPDKVVLTRRCLRHGGPCGLIRRA